MDRLDQLWHFGTESDWLGAVQEYWTVPTVKAKLALERRMTTMHAQRNQVTGSDLAFYQFLRDDLYPWKMDGYRIGTQQGNLDTYMEKKPLGIRNVRQALVSRMADIDSGKSSDFLKRLSVVGGMGVSVASGLLAVLWPSHFGTVDRFCLRGFLSVSNDPYTGFMAEVVKNPDTFFDDYTDPLRLHVADLMIQLYRHKAADLNSRFGTTVWNPRQVEMVVWTLRDS